VRPCRNGSVFGLAVLYGLIMINVNSVKAHNGDDGEYALSNPS
jgi:hypothetical protein